MPEITAGAVSLDLNIKNKLTEQIEQIANSAKAPAEKIGREIEKAVGASMDDAGNSVAQTLARAADSAVQAISKKMNELSSMIREKLGGLDFPSESAKEFTSQVDSLNDKLALMQKTWQELANSDPLSKASVKISQLEKKVTALEKKFGAMNTSKPTTSSSAKTAAKSTSKSGELGTADVINAVNGGAGGIAGLIGTVVSGNPAIGAAVGTATNGILGTVGKTFNKLTGLVNKLTGNAVAKLKSFSSSLLDITKPLLKIGKMIKGAFKRIFIASALYAAFRALKDGIIEAANADEQFSKSLNDVKANLAIAFTPIILHVLPYLDELMAKLAQTSKQVATFMAGLFGMTYKQAADARKKLDETIKTAKKAKNAIAGIDELNILGSDEEEQSGIDYSKLDLSEAKLPDWAEYLKKSIQDGDWEAVGRVLAYKVNTTLSDIDWDKIQSKIQGKLRNLVKLINSFVKEIDPKAIGKALAGSINTITSSILTFVDGINWEQLGAKIAQSLNETISRINWSNVGRTLTSGWRIAINALYGFSTQFNFAKLGTSLGTALNSAIHSIDTEKLAKGLSNTIRGIITTAVNLVDILDFEGIGTKLSQFVNNFDVGGITSELTALVLKIWNGVNAAVNTFLEQTDWEKLGSSLIEGMGEGAREAEKDGDGASGVLASTFKVFLNMQDAFKKLITGAIVGLLKHIRKCVEDATDGIVSDVTVKVASVLGKFEKLREDIEKVWETIGKWFGDRFSEARTNIEKTFSSLSTWFGDVRAKVNEAFANVGAWFAERFKAARTNVEDKFKDIGTWFSNRWDDIKEVFEGIGKWFKDKFNDAYADATDSDWLDLPGFFASLWEGVLDETIDGLNSILGKVESFANRIGDAFSDLAGTSKMAKTLVGHVFNTGITIPRLATGGLAKAPTLAMIGDNKNARSDPEVVAPLSQLEGLMGGSNAEVVQLLSVIVELLKNGISAELIGNMFGNDFKRTVLRIVAEDNARRG